MIGGAIRKRTQMECDGVIEPVVLPMIFLGNLMYDRRQPIRQRVLEFGYVDIFRGKPEIAGKHQRRVAVDRDLQLGPGLNCRATDLIECIEQCVAAEGCTHRVFLTKTPPPARASSG